MLPSEPAWQAVLEKLSVVNESPHIRRIESKYLAWNWFYFGRRINACKYTFTKKMPEMCGWKRTTFTTSHVIRCMIIFFVILLNCRLLCRGGGIAFNLLVGIWAISGCHCQPPCYERHLSEMHCKIGTSYNTVWNTVYLEILFGITFSSEFRNMA